jgi:hypothetical protein
MIRAAVHSLGYTIKRGSPDGKPTVPPAEFPADFSAEEQEICRLITPYTMTSKERVISLIRAVRYIERYKIPGAIVECGVWRGGSMMAVAKTLLADSSAERELFLFDTYCGMPEAGEADIDVDGRSGALQVEEIRRLPPNVRAERNVFAECPIEAVRTNLFSTGYPQSNLHFIKGMVENTIPEQAPREIALLRLDTDWYESTHHELVHLFPRLSHHGVLIVDDYGYWRGARLAVDDFFERNREPVLLSRVDEAGRIAVRC